MIRRGVPIDKIRIIILDIFKLTYVNNMDTYDSSLNSIFKGNVPNDFRNTPTF